MIAEADECANLIQNILNTVLNTPTHEGFESIRRQLNSLEYLLLVDRSPAIPHVHILTYHAKCAHCDITSAAEDANMKNFAPEGSTVPLWLCRNHHPTPSFKSTSSD